MADIKQDSFERMKVRKPCPVCGSRCGGCALQKGFADSTLPMRLYVLRCFQRTRARQRGAPIPHFEVGDAVQVRVRGQCLRGLARCVLQK